jgi:hypothetical protein
MNVILWRNLNECDKRMKVKPPNVMNFLTHQETHGLDTGMIKPLMDCYHCCHFLRDKAKLGKTDTHDIPTLANPLPGRNILIDLLLNI